MCEKEPKRRSCTECPQYDGMKCTAADMLMGNRDEVLQEEHRRGFICLDTGEAELKGDIVLQWTEEQERLRQVLGYKSVEEMWAACGKQVKSGVHIDEDNEHLEPILQISNGPGPVKLTFQYEENAKSVDDTMYHPNVAADSTDLHSATVRPHKEGNTFKMTIRLVDSNDSAAGSPSSECPSLREGPPQKGKIDENNSLRLGILRHPEATCRNCNKSHREGLRLVCDKWGLQDIMLPEHPCEKWAFAPSKVRAEEQQIHYAEGSGLQYVENPPPLWKPDTNGYWEPVRPRSCTNCKLYNDPICMKIGTHIGNRAQIWNREDLNGFQCIAALPKSEREAVITSIGCNKGEGIR